MHWSYSDDCKGDLAQGDILLPTDAMRACLDVAHKWFNDRKYLGFLVITQTCDLVRRPSCKSPYVEVAVIKPLRGHLLSLMKRQFEHVGERHFPEKVREKVNDLVDRIINQNESAHGIFYLHPEAKVKISESAVALLRVSIALRAEHYDTLLGARCGRLAPEFGNKLGWLCGNLYSRIGVKDWNEVESDRNDASKLKRLLLTSDDGGPIFAPWPKRFAEDIKSGQLDLNSATDAEVQAKLKEYSPKSMKENALDAVERVLKDKRVDPELVRKVRLVLNSDSEFSGAFRPASS